MKPAVLRTMRWQLFAQVMSNVRSLKYTDQAALHHNTIIFQELLMNECDVPKMTLVDDPPLPSMVAFQMEKGLGFKDSCDIWWGTVSKMISYMDSVDLSKLEADDIAMKEQLLEMKRPASLTSLKSKVLP